MRSYVLKHKNNGVYLKYFYQLGLKHYVPYIDEATRFDYAKAYNMKNKFKHRENWTIKRVS